MRIRKGDNVLVVTGKSRGERGNVLHVLPKEHLVLVEGANLRKKHVKPRRAGQRGQVVEMPSALPVSNVRLVCGKCGKPTRIGYKIEGTQKVRICKKCGAVI